MCPVVFLTIFCTHSPSQNHKIYFEVIFFVFFLVVFFISSRLNSLAQKVRFKSLHDFDCIFYLLEYHHRIVLFKPTFSLYFVDDV